MISFYILSKRFFQERKKLSDVTVSSITKKKNMVLKYIFCRDSKSFLPLLKNSVTIGLCLLLNISAIISSKAINIFFYLGCILECFYKYHPYHLSI